MTTRTPDSIAVPVVEGQPVRAVVLEDVSGWRIGYSHVTAAQEREAADLLEEVLGG